MKEILAMIEYCSFAELEEINKAVRKAKRKFPKQQFQKEEKTIDPVIEFRLKCHRQCKLWLCENGHKEHAWDVLQSKGLNGIIDKIKSSLTASGREVTEETVCCSFQGMMLKLPPFWANKIDFDLFDRRFSAIVSEIKSQKNVRQITDTESGYTDRFEKAAQRIAARHAGK